jgi:hypothetical protein
MVRTGNPVAWRVDLPPEAEQRRETFARFGLAVYESQCVEKQLAILLATACNLASPKPRQMSVSECLMPKTRGRWGKC